MKPQIVAGREFKGTAFISKPDKIFFKVCLHLSLIYLPPCLYTLKILLYAYQPFLNLLSLYRTLQLEFRTLRRSCSQTFHFRLIRSNCCLLRTKSKTFSTSCIRLPAVCLPVCQQRSRSLSPHNSTKTSTVCFRFCLKRAELIFHWFARARKLS